VTAILIGSPCRVPVCPLRRDAPVGGGFGWPGYAYVAAHGLHDLRHTFATWLEDGGVPARVIDELMGHQAGCRGEREGSMIGTRYRHMTEAMQARVIAERLAVALAAMPQVCPKFGSEREREAAC
jgi:integrase